MPAHSAVVGKQTRRFRHVADARWLMAYAAALGDRLPIYFDTTRPIVAHPLFPVCVEWPVVLDARHVEGAGRLTPVEASRGVHATHDLFIHKTITNGTELFTRAAIIGVEARRPGAYQVMRLDTEDANGTPITTTYQGSLARGVAVEGGDRWSERPPELPAHEGSTGGEVIELAVPAGLAHVYTECARIWNPIHTDRAVALAAGLPDIILHGTATLALAVSAIVAHRLDGDPRRVRRIACRFGAMVRVPTTLSMRIDRRSANGIWYTVLTATGEPAIRDGFIGSSDDGDVTS